ncbi:hypothetical protein Tco_0432876 [Tanacetum coccineum]
MGNNSNIALASFRITKSRTNHRRYPGSMPPKRTSTSEAPAMTQVAIRKLVVNNVATALEAQAVTMANAKIPIGTLEKEKLM